MYINLYRKFLGYIIFLKWIVKKETELIFYFHNITYFMIMDFDIGILNLNECLVLASFGTDHFFRTSISLLYLTLGIWGHFSPSIRFTSFSFYGFCLWTLIFISFLKCSAWFKPNDWEGNYVTLTQFFLNYSSAFFEMFRLSCWKRKSRSAIAEAKRLSQRMYDVLAKTLPLKLGDYLFTWCIKSTLLTGVLQLRNHCLNYIFSSNIYDGCVTKIH